MRKLDIQALLLGVLCACAILLQGADATLAATCQRNSSFHLTSEGPWNGSIVTSSAQPCGGQFTTRGTLTISAVTVAAAPQSGSVRLSGTGYSYKSNAGYHGADSFTLKVCGTEGTAKGCANIRYAVTVE